MKSQKETRASAEARASQFRRELDALGPLADRLVGGTYTGADLQAVRDRVENLVQCFHEFNAYQNVLNT